MKKIIVFFMLFIGCGVYGFSISDLTSKVSNMDSSKTLYLSSLNKSKNSYFQFVAKTNKYDNNIIQQYYNIKKSLYNEFNEIRVLSDIILEKNTDGLLTGNQLDSQISDVINQVTLFDSKYASMVSGFALNTDAFLNSNSISSSSSTSSNLISSSSTSSSANWQQIVDQIDMIIINEKLDTTNKFIDITKIYPIFQKAESLDQIKFKEKINNTLTKIESVLNSGNLSLANKYLMLSIKKAIINYLYLNKGNQNSLSIITVVTGSNQGKIATGVVTLPAEEKYFDFKSVRGYTLTIPSKVTYIGLGLKIKQTFGLKGISCDYKINMIESKKRDMLQSNPDLEVYECNFVKTTTLIDSLEKMGTVYLYDKTSKKNFVIKYYNDFGKNIAEKISVK